MSDNTTLDPGTGGDVIATDDIAGVKYQRVKLVDGTADSAAAIPGDATNGLDVDVTRSALPTGASTAAKQPALGTAGAASADVLSVQGVASMTALKVDGSGVTQPVSGSVTATGPLTDTQLRASAVPVDTELPAAAALADGAANPTSPAVGAFALLWNGSTWDRAPGGATNGLTANLKALNGTTIATNSGSKDAGTQRVVIATDQVQLTNALKVDGSAVTQPISGNVTNAGTFATQESQLIADDAAFTVATSKVFPVGYLADQASTDSVNEGDIGAGRMTLDRKQIVTLAPSADTEGLLVANNIDVDETEDAVKASAGKLYGWFFYNDGATEVYIKYYNDTVANVVVGTTVPFMTIPIPAGSASNIEWSHGIPFSLAITIAATTAAATADTGAPAANQVVGFSLYQ